MRGGSEQEPVVISRETESLLDTIHSYIHAHSETRLQRTGSDMKRMRSGLAAAALLHTLLLLALLVSFHSCGGSSGSALPASWTILLGTAGDDFGYDVAVDPAGDVLIAGSTSGSLDGAPFSGSTDLFLAKYAASGEKIWVRQRGAAGGIAIATDGSANSYVAGSASSSFDNNPHAGDADVVLVKYDAAGTLLWSTQFGTAGSDIANAIAVDGNGNVFLAGSTSGDLGGTGNSGSFDSFLAKIDPATGTLVWVEQVGTPFFEVGEGVATDNSGHIFLCGMTFNGDVEGTGSPPGGEDIFVASFLDNGAGAVREWVRQYGTGSDEYPVAVGFGGGTLYVTGYADGDLGGTANRGGQDYFLWRLDASDGASMGATLLGTPERDFAENLSVAADGSVYVVGKTNGDLDNTNRDPSTDPNTSSYDIFLSRFDGSGTLLWTRQTGTAEDDWGLSVALDGSGQAYVCGITRGRLDGNSNEGEWDAFLLKYNEAGEKQ